MKILDLLVMRGPNYWSGSHHRVVLLKLDLEELQTQPTHELPGFSENLLKLLPGLREHRSSHDREITFAESLQRGTWMAQVVEHVATELQNQAGIRVSYGRTWSGKEQGIYHVLYEYELEGAGKRAGETAVRICDALAKGENVDLQEELDSLHRLVRREKLGPSTGSIVDEALSRNIPCKRLDLGSLILMGQGTKQQKIRATVAGTTLGIGMEIARDKEETKSLLDAAHVPVPKGHLLYNEEQVIEKAKTMSFPVVMKPLNGNHGRGITTHIQNTEQALTAFRLALKISSPVIMEEFVEGDDHRLIVVNYRFTAAAKRTPAQVTGDGSSSIAELIADINRDPMRGEGHDNMLTRIEVDSVTEGILQREGLDLKSVLPRGRKLALKHTANLSTGGTPEDVTDQVHPYNVLLAERIARIVGLDICGIDVLAKDISLELTRDNGAVVEVNAGPGLRMHLEPTTGLPRNIAKPIIDMLFPEGSNGRIPIVAITGTNGKTTTTRLTAYLAQHAGDHKVGFTTTDGIYIQGQQVYKGDCTGPKSCEAVLGDPTVDFAVLECARGGLLRSGLAFSECDISIVTNVTADHLGLKGIETLEEMARVKAVVPLTTKRDGYAILNADDDLVYAIRNDLDCNVALFSMNADSDRLRKHCAQGGLAAAIDNGDVVVFDGKWRTKVEKLALIPLTLGGRAESMIKNIMPAILVCWIRGFDLNKVRSSLRSFVPSPELTPGRMNLFTFPDFELMVDYAHNIDGMHELKKFAERTEASKKIGIIGIAGDRRNEDIRAFGALSAQVFDEIIIRHDTDMRGRDKDEMTDLLVQGIEEGDPATKVKVISSEIEAVSHAIDHAPNGAFIIVCSEKVNDTLVLVEEKLRQRQAHAFHR